MINVNVIFNRKHRRELEVSVYNAGRRRYLALGIRLPEGAKYSNAWTRLRLITPSRLR